MSSIMRRRSGLMASSVMGMLLSWVKVANPSSQDRTLRRAILLAVTPAAASYRASGLVRWHFSDGTAGLRNVCCWGKSGRRDCVTRLPSLLRVSDAGRSQRCGLHGGRRPTAFKDRKSTRLNSSHDQLSYAVFCLKKKKKSTTNLFIQQKISESILKEIYFG